MKKSLGAKTIAMPLPTWLIGTYDSNGKPNIMAAAWVGIVCSQPPAVGVSLRKATATYDSIMANKAFTVNIPSQAQVKETDYAGLVSGRDTDKFGGAGFTAVRSELIHAPLVSQVPLTLECKLLHTIEIGLHTQFVGEILDVKAEEGILGESGFPDAALAKAFCWDPGSMSYYGIGPLLGKAFSIGKEIVRPDR